MISWSRRRAAKAALFLAVQLFVTAVIGAPDIDRASNDSLLWGPYRSNLYFGVRPRRHDSLTTGILWARLDDFQAAQRNFRHTCEQDEIKGGYGWEEYDARTGGRQTFHDDENLLDLSTEFVKFPEKGSGGSWAARISGKPQRNAPDDMATTIIFYVGMEGLGTMNLVNEREPLGYKETIKIEGKSQNFGPFSVDVTEGPETNQPPLAVQRVSDEKPMDRTKVRGVGLPKHLFWQAKNLLFNQFRAELNQYVEQYGQEEEPHPFQIFTVKNVVEDKPNLFFVQKTFQGAFEFDIMFSSDTEAGSITSEEVTQRLKSVSSDFQQRFDHVFPAKAPFDKADYKQFFRAMFSNLLGGVGYFYGDAAIDRSYAPEYDEENDQFWTEAAEAKARAKRSMEGPYELLSAVPSRPFFPRGFMWDEGFHLLPIAEWDVGITIEILKSWVNLMDEDGWIAREQILGDEARSKVPEEFQIQYPHYANPPTLFLVFETLLDKADSKKISTKETELVESTLQSIYPLLRRHYFWYRKTQFGDIKSYDREAFSKKEAYRWRGRTPTHILTSGLDDYPRAQPPHPGELHVDLLSWIGLMTRIMKRIATKVRETDDVSEYSKYETAILRNVDDLHWDEKEKVYCDSSVNEYEEDVHVCHKGYVSLFPFITGLLPPDSPKLGATLDLLSDPEELWSESGIRSLSKKDEFYGTEENYWRGPIWMNINYLILDNLKKTALAKGPYQRKARDIYTKLRKNLVETVYNSWTTTGYAWEQYHPDTGIGQRTQHFTGWTSLVVKMMSMPDLESGRTHEEL